MNRKIITLLLGVFCLLNLGTVQTLNAQSYEGHVITNKGAWCWFADPRATYYENTDGSIKNTYIGYIDAHGAIKATQYDHIANKSSEVLIRSYFQPDDHDNPTFLALPDGRIMIFYSRHTDEPCFYYRISQKPGDITTLGEEKVLKTDANTTYPSPFILSNDPDHIYLCWRGINWHPTIGRLTMPDENDNVSFDWGPKQIVQSTGARPYAKYYSNGTDKIYLTYTTGHPDNENPNWVYFNYIEINADATKNKLTDVKGKQLSLINNGPHQVNKKDEYATSNPDAVVNKENYRNWVWQVSKESNGNPVIAMVRIDNAKDNHDYYHVRWNGSSWEQVHLAYGGGHFHQTPGLEKCYSGGMAIDDENPNIMYCSVPVDGENGKVYEIVKYTVTDGVVASEQITKNSRLNNIRPYIITNTAADNELRLIWMHGEYYDWIVSQERPLGYATGINADFAFPQPEVDLENGLIKYENFDAAVEGTATVEGGLLITKTNTEATIVTGNSSTEFSVSLTPKISESAYSGKIFQAGTISYQVENALLNTGRGTENMQCPFPNVLIGSDKYKSTNVLGTADSWQNYGRGTGGKWYEPTKLQFFNLTVTYKNDTLTTYIDGLIDQVIVAQGLTLGDVKIGGFEGEVEDCRVYSRAISQGEIKAIISNYNDKLEEIEFNRITLPEYVYTDIVLKSKSSAGTAITWESSNKDVISNSGLVYQGEAETPVKLTATLGGLTKTFDVKVMPRDIEKNKVLLYEFETADESTEGSVRYIADKSGNGNNGTLYGKAVVNGKLNLTENVGSNASNGYAMAPNGIIDDVRSYSVLVSVYPKNLKQQPRIYDFGSGTGNSMFGRLSKLTIGFKYNGGSTVMIDASKTLDPIQPVQLAYTFDAKTKTSKIFVDGEEAASGTTITNEPYQLSEIAESNRNYIGRTQWQTSDNADFCGEIDNFYLFNIALTADEIKKLQPKLPPITSNENYKTQSSISIFPNPVAPNTTVQIEYPFSYNDNGVEIEVFDTKGQMIQNYRFTSSPITVKSPATTGIYLIRATNETNQAIIEKLIVQ